MINFRMHVSSRRNLCKLHTSRESACMCTHITHRDSENPRKSYARIRARTFAHLLQHTHTHMRRGYPLNYLRWVFFSSTTTQNEISFCTGVHLEGPPVSQVRFHNAIIFIRCVILRGNAAHQLNIKLPSRFINWALSMAPRKKLAHNINGEETRHESNKGVVRSHPIILLTPSFFPLRSVCFFFLSTQYL